MNHGILRRNHAERHLHVGLRKVDLFRSLLRDREVRKGDVHLAGVHVLNAGCRVQRGELYLDAEILRDALRIDHVVALIHAVLIYVAEGRLVRKHTDANHTGLLDLIHRAEGRLACAFTLCRAAVCLLAAAASREHTECKCRHRRQYQSLLHLHFLRMLSNHLPYASFDSVLCFVLF